MDGLLQEVSVCMQHQCIISNHWPSHCTSTSHEWDKKINRSYNNKKKKLQTSNTAWHLVHNTNQVKGHYLQSSALVRLPSVLCHTLNVQPAGHYTLKAYADITAYVNKYPPHGDIWPSDMAAICLDCKSQWRGQRGLTGVTPLWPHPSSEPQSLDINCALCQLGNWIQIGSLCSGWYVRNYTMKGIPYRVHCYSEHPSSLFTHQPQTAAQRYVPVQNQFHELEREEGIVSE